MPDMQNGDSRTGSHMLHLCLRIPKWSLWMKKQTPFSITRADLEKQKREYLKQGGRVLILPPEKTVETDRLIYMGQPGTLPEVDLVA